MLSYIISLIGLLLLSCIVQQFLPPIAPWYGARVLVLPLVVLCGSVTVSTAGMLVLAFLGGFLWDSQHIIQHPTLNPAVFAPPSDSLKFGYSIILYAFMGFLMQGIRPMFQEGKWYLSAGLTGVAIFLYLFAEHLLRCFVRGSLDFDNGIINQIGMTSLFTMLASPVVFWMLYRIADLCGHEISD